MLLSQNEEREILRKNARAEAERWGWAAATKQLEGFYQDILDSVSGLKAA